MEILDTGFFLSEEILVILMAMLPVIELRGAIPMGISMGMSPVKSMLLSILGNILIVPLILYILNPIMDLLEKNKVFIGSIDFLKKRSIRKAALIKKYRDLGLLIFVAIPIPTTGAWTGSFISKILRIDKKEAIFMISLGLIISGIVVTTISCCFQFIF